MKYLFRSISKKDKTSFLFVEMPSFKETPSVFLNKEDKEGSTEDINNLIISVLRLPEKNKTAIIAEMKHGIIPGAEVLGETVATEAIAVISNKNEGGSINLPVTWSSSVYKNEPDVEVKTSLFSENVSMSPIGKKLQSLNEKKGIKGNYISSKNGVFVFNPEKGEYEKISLEKAIVKVFEHLNSYIRRHGVSDKNFQKACSRKGLTGEDIQNLQSLRKFGRMNGAEKSTDQDTGILQNILKKVGLKKGLGKDGTPDELLGSGTVEDTESLCLILESSLEQEIEWDTFNDTLYPIPNGSYSLFHASIRNIKKTERYDPEQDPLKVFDNTLVAQGGSLKSGGNKFYSIGFLATIPEDILSKITNESTKETILSNRKLRLDCEQEWTNFQKQNPQYFQI